MAGTPPTRPSCSPRSPTGFPSIPDIHVSGIEQVRSADIRFAKSLGYVVKLLAMIREHRDGSVELRVQPSFIAQSNILASVHGVFNAIAIHGDAAGESLFYGRGAGQDPTASSVVADLVEAARSLGQDRRSPRFPALP
jgi:homoserine dehydrogenase